MGTTTFGIKSDEELEESSKLNDDSRNILDFSDCVLTVILSYVNSYDLYSLSKTCTRFSYLIKERKLWKKVDLVSNAMCARKFRFFFENFNDMTDTLMICGINKKEKTLTSTQFLKMLYICDHLSVLSIENQYINSDEVRLSDFPVTLQELSLRGTHITGKQAFLEDAHKKLTNLHTLVLDDCKWFHEHSLMALSKLVKLENLSLYNCRNLNDSIAYMSVTARYGFQKLLRIDARQTSIGDQFLKCFHCIKTLREIYLENPLIKRPKKSTIIDRINKWCNTEASRPNVVIFNHCRPFSKSKAGAKVPRKLKKLDGFKREDTLDCLEKYFDCTVDNCGLLQAYVKEEEYDEALYKEEQYQMNFSDTATLSDIYGEDEPQETLYCDDVSDSEDEFDFGIFHSDVTDSGVQWFCSSDPQNVDNQGHQSMLFRKPYGECHCGQNGPRVVSDPAVPGPSGLNDPKRKRPTELEDLFRLVERSKRKRPENNPERDLKCERNADNEKLDYSGHGSPSDKSRLETNEPGLKRSKDEKMNDVGHQISQPEETSGNSGHNIDSNQETPQPKNDSGNERPEISGCDDLDRERPTEDTTSKHKRPKDDPESDEPGKNSKADDSPQKKSKRSKDHPKSKRPGSDESNDPSVKRSREEESIKCSDKDQTTSSRKRPKDDSKNEKPGTSGHSDPEPESKRPGTSGCDDPKANNPRERQSRRKKSDSNSSDSGIEAPKSRKSELKSRKKKKKRSSEPRHPRWKLSDSETLQRIGQMPLGSMSGMDIAEAIRQRIHALSRQLLEAKPTSGTSDENDNENPDANAVPSNGETYTRIKKLRKTFTVRQLVPRQNEGNRSVIRFGSGRLVHVRRRSELIRQKLGEFMRNYNGYGEVGCESLHEDSSGEEIPANPTDAPREQDPKSPSKTPDEIAIEMTLKIDDSWNKYMKSEASNDPSAPGPSGTSRQGSDNKSPQRKASVESDPDPSAPSTSGAPPKKADRPKHVIYKRPSSSITVDLQVGGPVHVEIVNGNNNNNSNPPPRPAPSPQRTRDLRVIIERLEPGLHVVIDRDGRIQFGTVKENNFTKLKVLMARGYKMITDQALRALMDIRLELLDVTGTSVTEQGVKEFLMVNPDCRVVHQSFCNCG